MVDVIGSSATSSNPAVRSTAKTPSVAQEQTAPTTKQDVQPISPVLRSDPLAGVMITEYRSEDGTVTSQIPSAAAVAYLRMGLTATGEKPQDETAKAQDTSKNLLA